MNWHELTDPKSPELDRLAELYHLHPLHIEDCRHRNQRAKVEEGKDYLFVVLKPVEFPDSGELGITDFDIFLGKDWVITVRETSCPTFSKMLDQVRTKNEIKRADQLFYRIFDALVDSYLPILDSCSDQIDVIEEVVLENPSPDTLQKIFALKRALIELRRVLSNSRDVAGHLQRTETDLIQRDMWPFLRDVYDHLARNMDLVETQRDLLTGAMDIYLSSVANRTNQVMKVLTVLGTVALPSVVVSGFFGMNTKGLPLTNNPHGTIYATLIMCAATGLLLALLKKFDWF